MKSQKDLVIKFFSLIIFLIPLFNGCSDTPLNIEDSIKIKNDKNWITLPKTISNNNSIEAQFSITQTINGTIGGEMIIDKNYYSSRGEVKLIAKMLFPKGCFSGTKSITMILEDINGTVTYFPSMNFNIPAELYLKFENIDLHGAKPGDIDFVYQPADGNFYKVSYKEIIVDIQKGILELKEAKIPHFSRYGWCR